MTERRNGLWCWLRPDQPPVRFHRCRFAGRTLVTDATVAPLAPFGVAETTLALPRRAPLLTGSGELVCRSTGWIDNAWREVNVWRHEQGLRVHLAGVGEFMVMPNGTAVIRLDVEVTDTTLVEALLGPPLLLVLALNGVWCLHASAVNVNDQVVAFAGESGNGKSTLAAHLGSAGETGWRRLADDMLPLSLERDGLLALPHFPQLKLTDVEQYPVDAPESLPLAAVYVIAPQNEQDPVSVRRLGERQAMQALIRHTVAARLFDRTLLAAHLDFCAEASARIPVWRLAYPHRREVLPQVQNAIRRSMSHSHGDSGRRDDFENAGK